MEDQKHSFSSPVEPIEMMTLRSRQLPDVPEDVDFLMEHLNDPNFDLTKSYPPSTFSVATDTQAKKIYAYDRHSDYDTDSHFDSERPGSRNSTAVEFDE
jgi:hypothetical protein